MRDEEEVLPRGTTSIAGGRTQERGGRKTETTDRKGCSSLDGFSRQLADLVDWLDWLR
jgi:hypothetical protein